MATPRHQPPSHIVRLAISNFCIRLLVFYNLCSYLYLGGKKDWMFFSYCKHDPSFWTKYSRLLAYWMICLLLLTNPRVPVRRSTNGILLLRLITRGMVGISPFVQLITRPAKWFSIFNKNKQGVKAGVGT